MTCNLALLLATLATAAAAGLPASGEVPSSGFGVYIEGASVDAVGNVYATHFRNSTDASNAGNLANRNVIGVVSAATGEASAYFVGEEGSWFLGMRWDPSGRYLFLTDAGRARVVRVDLATMRAEDHCGADGSLADTGAPNATFTPNDFRFAPNDLALARNGMIYLSGMNYLLSTGGLWLCKPNGSVLRLESVNRTNGIALSPDDDFLYLTEAGVGPGAPAPDPDFEGGQRIWRYRVDKETGEVSEKTEFFDFALHPAGPEAHIDSDGMRTDTAGNLWVTRFGGGKVTVLSPNGSVLRDVPLSQTDYPTNLAFGGLAGTTLYVVGWCDGASFGAGDGCMEAMETESVGREWALLREGSGEEGPSTSPSVDNSGAFAAIVGAGLFVAIDAFLGVWLVPLI